MKKAWQLMFVLSFLAKILILPISITCFVINSPILMLLLVRIHLGISKGTAPWDSWAPKKQSYDTISQSRMSISSSPRTPRPCLKSWPENPFSKPRHIIRTLFPAKFGAAGKGVGGEISSLRQMLGSNGHILPLKGSWAHLAMGEAAWVFQGISAQP